MKTTNATMLALGLITLVASSTQAVRMISAEDINVIPGAAYYVVHGKDACEQNDALVHASSLLRSKNRHNLITKCSSHKLIKKLLKKHKSTDARIITYHDTKHAPIAIVEIGTAEILNNPRIRLDADAKPVVACAVITKHIKAAGKVVTLYDAFNNKITSDWDVEVFEYTEQQRRSESCPQITYTTRVRGGFSPEISQVLDVSNCLIFDKTNQSMKKQLK